MTIEISSSASAPHPPAERPDQVPPPKKPSGWRRLSEGQLKGEALLREWRGLPYKVDTPWKLLATFKSAASYLGISRTLVAAMDWLFGKTQAKDWDKSSRPMVWPSAELMGHDLQLGVTQTKAVVRGLVDAGLIVMKDSPNGKRYGIRNGRGEIVIAYGFDLSPLAIRYQEFLDAAEAAQHERAARQDYRRRVTIAGRRWREIEETSREWGIVFDPTLCDPAGLGEVIIEVRSLARDPHASLDIIGAGLTAVEQRVEVAQAMLSNALKLMENTKNTDPREPEYRPHIYIQTKDKSIIENVEPEIRSESVDNFAAMTAEDGPQLKLTIMEAMDLFPRVGRCVRTSKPSWSDFTDAADIVRMQMGIGKHLWGQACIELGRAQAAVAIGIISLKGDHYFTSGKGSYLYGMVRKNEEGTLHLERTIAGLKEKKRQELRQKIRH